MRGNVFAPVDPVQPIETGHPLARGLWSWHIGLPGRVGNAWVSNLVRARPPAVFRAGALSPVWSGGDPTGLPSIRQTGVAGQGCDVSGPLTPPMPAFTYAGFVFPTGTTYNAIYSTNSRIWFFLGPNQSVYFYTDAGNGEFVGSAPYSCPNNRWHHVVWTREGASITNGMRSYVNGVQVGQVNTGDTTSFPATDYYLGVSASGFPFNGLIRDVMVWDRALSALEIAHLHREARSAYPDLLRRPRSVASYFAPAAFQVSWRRRQPVLTAGVC